MDETMQGIRLIRRFWGLAPSDRRLLVLAVWQLCWVGMLARIFGFQSLVRQAQGIRPPNDYTPSPVELERAYVYAHWLESAARRRLINAYCLQRSLALHRWLQREGMPSVLQIGVWKGGDVLHAHAWVELGNHVVNDRPAAIASFVPLAQNLPKQV